MSPRRRLLALYFDAVLGRPLVVLGAAAALVAALAAFIPRFELDVSAESLVLAEDRALEYYRAIRARYGSDDFLVVTYTPPGELFERATLERVRALRERLAGLERVQAVTSLLDVPLLAGAGGLDALQANPRTLLDAGIDLARAKQDMTSSPLYRDLLVSADGRTTAIRLDLARDAEPDALRTGRLVADVRAILEDSREAATVRLVGVPMIVADMAGFVRHDLRVFGAGAALFIALLLALAFRRARWVLVPLALCAAAGVATTGFLGLAGWRVTVVSANYVAVLLIITLSLCVHLIVRYEELRAGDARLGQRALLEGTMRSKLAPSLYTALTTAVAFGSLTATGLRPVADFGWIMVVGIALAFVLVAAAFPAALARFGPSRPVVRRFDAAGAFAAGCARAGAARPRLTLGLAAALLAAGAAGMARLTVENRFTDYFKADTAIHRGMTTLDRELGGSTPLDVIVDAPAGAGAQGAAGGGFTAQSYWFNAFRLERVARAHDWLERLESTGKVLSPATAVRVLEQAHGGPLGNFMLALTYERLPPRVKQTLFEPYLSEDGDQLRYSVRVYETRGTLERDALLERIRAELPAQLGVEPDRVHLTGMTVLYNNVLQQLYRSQALTLAVVFALIGLMFAAVFRSPRIAALALVPGVLAAALVLGLIGALGIPLDIMTITIAAITLGIGVDDTIHYVHRYLEERRAGRDARAAIGRTHAGTGRALVYTSVTLALGFSVFTLSDFVPTVHFGLLAGFAILAALAANLTLLPALLVTFGPRVR